jgi:hypothetical protein
MSKLKLQEAVTSEAVTSEAVTSEAVTSEAVTSEAVTSEAVKTIKNHIILLVQIQHFFQLSFVSLK